MQASDKPTQPYQPKNFNLAGDQIWPRTGELDPYLFNDEICICIDVALATNRPLLVSGRPGSGKSMLAPTLAAIKGWRYLPYTFTSRSRLEDLTGDLDHLRRLNDAQAARSGEPLPPRWTYMEPGVLWWAFHPDSAARRGAAVDDFDRYYAKLKADAATRDLADGLHTSMNGPRVEQTGAIPTGAVVLLDEIDKAEPDLPNDLLEPLERRRFPVPQGPQVVADENLDCLVVITTNGERELPPAFLRRCVSLVLKDPDEDQLVRIAGEHFREGGNPALHRAVARRVIELRRAAKDADRRPPSTSEYLDAIKACAALAVDPDGEHFVWQQISKATLAKPGPDDDADENSRAAR